jgi:preprotein translocase subunit YajC
MLATPAFAQTAATTSAAGGGTMFLLLQFVLIGIIFWFFLIRPQQRRAKEHRALIDSVKKGDTVITAGGIYGKVSKVDTNVVELEIASGVRIKVVKSTLTDVQPLGGAKAAND